MKTAKQMIKEHKEFMKLRESIYKENEALIKYWRSIPWWQFWKKVPFEEQSAIITKNWEKIKRYTNPA